MAVSLGISDALVPYTDNLKIKWPNDIYAGGRKLGGILIKNNLKGHLITSTITGIGLNINQQGFALPNAVSLNMLTGDHYELPFMLSEVCYAIEGRYLAMLRGADLKTDYLNRLYLWNKSHLFRSGGANFHGTIRDVKPSGELVIETDQGVQEFRFKEVELV
jgi:BirA family biotin operon repressor/biotin-[acetyl-CoA-carboxylase] ligase